MPSLVQYSGTMYKLPYISCIPRIVTAVRLAQSPQTSLSMASLLYHRIFLIDFAKTFAAFLSSRLEDKRFFFCSQKRHDAFITIDERHVGDERDVHFRVDSHRFFLHFTYYLISNLIISHYYATCMLGERAREHKKIQMK